MVTLSLIYVVELVEKLVVVGGRVVGGSLKVILVFYFGPNLFLQISVLDLDQAEQKV